MAAMKPTATQHEAAIRETDKLWLEAVTKRDAERAISFWSDDALVLPPDAPVIAGKEAIRSFVGGAFSDPNFSIRWVTDEVHVSANGDMAYATGTNQVTATGPNGKVFTQRGKGITVWKKQADGAWKCVVDIWNSLPPDSQA